MPVFAAAAGPEDAAETKETRASRLAMEIFEGCAVSTWLASDREEDHAALQQNLETLECDPAEIEGLMAGVPYEIRALKDAAERLTALIEMGQKNFPPEKGVVRSNMRKANRALLPHIHVTMTDEPHCTQLSGELARLDLDEQNKYVSVLQSALGRRYVYADLIRALHIHRVPPHKEKPKPAAKPVAPAPAPAPAAAAAAGSGDAHDAEDEEAGGIDGEESDGDAHDEEDDD